MTTVNTPPSQPDNAPVSGAIVVFCDLDGTMVLENSFHAFLSICFRETKGLHRFRLLLNIGLRVLGRVSGGHAALKQRVLRWFHSLPPTTQSALIADTCRTLDRALSAPVKRHLARLKLEGAELVLATAAPAVYANDFARSHGFDACVATPSPTKSPWRECLGEQKQKACEAWLAQTHNDPHTIRRIVLSDHPDDLPLMRGAEAVVLCCNARRAAQIEASLLPSCTVSVIDPERAQRDGGFWLWFDGSPRGPLDEWELRTILSKHRYAALYVGAGQWRRHRPGDDHQRAVLRTDCPLAPSALSRLRLHVHRRIQRDLLGIFH